MLDIDTEELIALYGSRFPQMLTHETAMWFDADDSGDKRGGQPPGHVLSPPLCSWQKPAGPGGEGGGVSL